MATRSMKATITTFRLPVLLLLLFLIALPGRAAFSQIAVIRGVLFYSPTCPHCHEVMNEVLPPLVEQFPEQLDIAGVDVSHPVGSALYQAFLNAFAVPDDRIGVPTMVVGQTVLVGSAEIPEQLPGIIETGLAQGGIDWPAIPGLQKVLDAQPAADTIAAGGATVAATPAQPAPAGPLAKFMADPLANTIAVVVELLMLAAVVLAAVAYATGGDNRLFHWPNAALPALSVAGLGVAGYLSYTYLAKTEVVCGPVGNCGAVQNSPYAYLFGILPVGVLGLFGYLAILGAWLVKQAGPANLRKPMAIAIWGFAWFGVLFSIYLTFLEPFVIGASCAWCLTSAIIMTMVFLASTGPALKALKIEHLEDDLDEVDDQRADAHA